MSGGPRHPDNRPAFRLFRLGVGGPEPDEEVGWEIEHYLAEQTERLIDEGWDEVDAKAEAERRFGDPGRYRPRLERTQRRRKRMKRWTAAWDTVLGAVESTGRTLARTPGFALAVVATLALGIGANAAMFGIIDRLLLRPPLHIDAPGEIVRFALDRGDGNLQTTITYPDFEDFEEGRAFVEVAALSHPRDFTLGTGAEAEPLAVRLVTHDFFTTLGVGPSAGRFFGPEEDRLGRPVTVVLADEFWQRRFARDRSVLGRTLEISGQPATVVGIAPPGFTGVDLGAVDAWMPLVATQSAMNGDGFVNARGSYWLRAVARIAPEVSPELASDEATRLHHNARAPEDGSAPSRPLPRIDVAPFLAGAGAAAGSASGSGGVVTWLAWVSLLVLLIACANVANLLLARSARRRREVAVRLALGVSRARLVGGMILETMVLALLGGAVALVLATWGGDALRRVLLPEVFFPASGGMTLRLAVFAVAVSLAAGLVAGLVPALQSTRADLTVDLGQGSRGNSGRLRMRGALAVAQTAVSVILLVGAGLFVKSLAQVRATDLGFDVDDLLLGTLEFEVEDLSNDEVVRVYGQAAEAVTRIPGVTAAAATSAPFFYNYAERLSVPGVDSIPRMPGGGPYYYAVSPGYLEAVGVEVLEGRGIEAGDAGSGASGGRRVAVVSRSMADSLWPTGAIGQCMLFDEDPECVTVVGVAEEAARSGLENDPFFAYYLPLGISSDPARGLYIRADDPEAAAVEVARTLRSFSSDIRYARVETLIDVLDPLARSWKLGATMFTALGVLALLVAAVGLYSLLAFNVAERRRELGIRSALGARKGRLLGSVLVQGTRLTVFGVAAGLLVALLAAPYARDLLFHVSPRDPVVFVGVAVVLVGVSAVASLLPGVRATRVDPMVALRTD